MTHNVNDIQGICEVTPKGVAPHRVRTLALEVPSLYSLPFFPIEFKVRASLTTPLTCISKKSLVSPGFHEDPHSKQPPHCRQAHCSFSFLLLGIRFRKIFILNALSLD